MSRGEGMINCTETSVDIIIHDSEKLGILESNRKNALRRELHYKHFAIIPRSRISELI